MSDDIQVSELFAAIVAYATAHGAERINELPGCWEAQIDDTLFVAVNGHNEPRTPSRGPELEPFDAYLEGNGWPLGIINPAGGTIFIASEDELIERIRAATPEPEPTQ